MQKPTSSLDQRLRQSVIGSRLLWLLESIIRLFTHSKLGAYLLSDRKTDEALESSATLAAAEFVMYKRKKRFSMRHRLLADSESSKIVRLLHLICMRLLRAPAKVYGFFFFSAGFFTVTFESITFLYEDTAAFFTTNFFIGILFVIVSFPLFRKEIPFHQAISEGGLLRKIFCDFLGVAKSNLLPLTWPFQEYLALILGFGLAALLFLLDAKIVILTLLFFVFAAITFTRPETGTILSLFLMVLVPTRVLGVFLAVTAIAYFCKVLIGKRSLRMELLDICVIAFLVVLFLSAAITTIGIAWTNLIALMLFASMFFLVANLLTDAEWLSRGITALFSGISLSALLGIYEFASGRAATIWQDATLFADLSGRAGSTLANPNLFASVLVLILPLSLAASLEKNLKKSIRYPAMFCAGLSAIALVLTWSRSGWIAAMAALLIFLLLFSRKTLFFLVPACLLFPFFSLFMPDMVLRRIGSIFTLSDTSTSYRLGIWKQSLDMIRDHLFSGIGYGESVFRTVAKQYPVAGITAEAHAHSLYLQILLSAGLVALILLFAVVLLLTRKVLTFHRMQHSKHTAFPYRNFASAAFAGIIGLLVQGLFDYPWYSYRVFAAFWCVFAVAVAMVRACRTHVPDSMEAHNTYTIDLL